MNEGKTVANYLGSICPGPLPKSILEKYAKEPGFNGLIFCDRCWRMQPLSREAADILIGFGEEAYGQGVHFNPLTHYFVTSCCPSCSGENATASCGYAKAGDYPQETVLNTGVYSTGSVEQGHPGLAAAVALFPSGS